MRNRHDWRFEEFAIVLLQTILFHMIAGLVFPDFYGKAKIDLKESFFAHRHWFFFTGFACVVVGVIKSLILDRKLPGLSDLVFHGIFAVTLFSGALTQRGRYHKALVVFANAVFVLYIVLLYARMR